MAYTTTAQGLQNQRLTQEGIIGVPPVRKIRQRWVGIQFVGTGSIAVSAVRKK